MFYRGPKTRTCIDEVETDGKSGVGAALGTGEWRLALVSTIVDSLKVSLSCIYLVQDLSDTSGFFDKFLLVDGFSVSIRAMPGPQRWGCHALARERIWNINNLSRVHAVDSSRKPSSRGTASGEAGFPLTRLSLNKCQQ